MNDERDYFVHESSFIDEPCAIGTGTKIWHFCHVMQNAVIGDHCTVGQNVVISPHCVMGNHVKIQNNVSLYTGVTLEDDVFCGPSMVFTNVVNPRSHVPRKDEFQRTLVKRGASIGANATVVCGVTLGRYCFIGAGAVITRDVPDYALVYGNPARLRGWMCTCGIKLDLGTQPDSCETAACSACGRRYHKEGLRVTEVPEAPRLDASTTRQSGPLTVPLLDLKMQFGAIEAEVMEALREVCAAQQFILGARVKELEARVAAYSQCRYGIGVSSGTDALLVALMALDVGPGDEVITTPFTFFATGGTVARLGARPLFCDIDPVTYNLSPTAVADLIAAQCARRDGRLINRRTGGVVKVLMPVHLFGQTADMDALLELARRHGLNVVEDAAQAIGAEHLGGRRAGSLGDIGCFSFFPSKNLGAFGDAGMCTTNDPLLAERLQVLRVHGAKTKYHHTVMGGNFRLDELQAAVLLVKFTYLDSWTARRQANARRYDAAFQQAGLAGRVATPQVLEGRRHIFNQYVLRVERRDELRASLTAANIGTEVYYPVPLHLQPCFAGLGYRPEDCRQSRRAAEETLALPIYPELTEAQQQYVVDTIGAFYGHAHNAG